MIKSTAAAGIVAVADVAADAPTASTEPAGRAFRVSRLTVAVGILTVIALVA